MEITWYGQQCFRITERKKTTILTNPYPFSQGLAPPSKFKANLVTLSDIPEDNNLMHWVDQNPYVIMTPGEYEISETFVTGIALHDHLCRDNGYNVGYLIDNDKLTVFHAGNLSHVPNQSVFENLSKVDVLLLSVGDDSDLNADQASEIVTLIDPHYVVPMGNFSNVDALTPFFKTIGVSDFEVVSTLKVNQRDEMQPMQVLVLEPYLRQST